MKFPSKDAGQGLSDFRVATVLLFVILNLSVALIRLISVWRYGALFSTTGGEPLVIYPVWKGVHHLPVYEWPLAYPFSLALYNYLFYGTYAFLLRLVSADGTGIILWGHLFTPLFATMGAMAQWRLVQYHLNLRGARSVLSLVFAVSLWFCASIVRGWALAIRPDMAAIALVMIALWMIVRQPRFGSVLASVFFYLAWSFKQSVVLAFLGVCLFLLFHKRWRALSILVVIFVALAAATLLLGTPAYRYNILVAPRLVKDWSFIYVAQIAPKSLLGNAYWLLAPMALLLATGACRTDHAVRMLTVVLIVALIGGLAGMTKVGAWDHYLLEAFAAGSTLLQIAVFAAPGRLVNAFVLFGCVQPAILAATAPSGATCTHTFGTVGIATVAQYADAVALRERLAPMKKPLFTTDEIFALPWFSTGNGYPALVIDPIFHNATRANCRNGCVEGMLQRGEIPTVVLKSDDTSYLRSLSPSYKKVGEAFYLDRLWSIYGLKPQAPATYPSIKHSSAEGR
jgi:hypothetical protein